MTLKKKKKANNQSGWISLKKQEVTSSLARAPGKDGKSSGSIHESKKINVSQVPLRKHICTLSVGRINRWLFSPSFHKEHWWREAASWILSRSLPLTATSGWGMGIRAASIQSSNLSSVAIFKENKQHIHSRLSSQTGEQTRNESKCLKCYLGYPVTPVPQGCIFGLEILLEFFFFFQFLRRWGE